MSTATHELHGQEVGLTGFETSLGNRYNSIKYLLDSPLALGLLLVFCPVILLAMMAIRLTSQGPVFYTQRRLGQNGRVFTILKLRTMYHDSEPTGPRWCVPGDPRITPVGRFLRLSHLDELPQLVNVLRGEMSLIGPRPERPEIVTRLERSIPKYRYRLVVRPGLTGLAQVIQPPDTDLSSVQTKLEYDLIYVDRMNLWFDIRILAGTVLHVLNVPGTTVAALLGFPTLNPADVPA